MRSTEITFIVTLIFSAVIKIPSHRFREPYCNQERKKLVTTVIVRRNTAEDKL